MTREQIALLITQIVAFVAYLAKGPLPAEWQPYIPWVIGAIEAVGGLVTFLFNQQTKAEIASLRVKVKSLGG